MKTIATLDKYYETITTEPYSIIVFSSLKTCHPCRKLKEWMSEKYPLIEGVFDIEIIEPEFESLSNDIDCLPTLVLYHYTETIKKVEGFDKNEVERLISKLKEKQALPPSDKPTITIL